MRLSLIASIITERPGLVKTIAAADFAATAAVLNTRFGLSEAEVREQYDIIDRALKFDKVFFDDFCSENRWQQHTGQQNGPSDLGQWIWPDGLKSIDPALVTPAPPPC